MFSAQRTVDKGSANDRAVGGAVVVDYLPVRAVRLQVVRNGDHVADRRRRTNILQRVTSVLRAQVAILLEPLVCLVHAVIESLHILRLQKRVRRVDTEVLDQAVVVDRRVLLLGVEARDDPGPDTL